MAKHRSLGFIGALGNHTCAALLGSEPLLYGTLGGLAGRLLAGRSARSQHPFHENEKYKFFYSLAIYRRRAPLREGHPPGRTRGGVPPPRMPWRVPRRGRARVRMIELRADDRL